MKRALWMAFLLGSSALAAAQTRQPAQITTLPTTSPQEFDLLDNTGTWFQLGKLEGGRFRPVFGRDPRDPPWNAKCDAVLSGTTWTGSDDTLALQTWAASTPDNSKLNITGACKFTGQIAFPPSSYGVLLEGGTLLYAGASTTLNPVVQIGQRNSSNGCAATKLTIRNLELLSSTVMTAGDGLRLSDLCQPDITGLTVGGTLGHVNTNWWNGVRYDGGNSVHTRGFTFSAQNDAIAINGDNGVVRQFTDPMFSQGVVYSSTVGFHICGAVGGFEADQTSVINNAQNVLIDRTCVNRPYAQLFFGPTFVSDVTSGGAGIGVHVSDPGGPQSVIIYKGWLASAVNQCFVFDAGTPDNPAFPPQVDFLGARIGNCHAPAGSHATGIENQSTYARISVLGSHFFTSLAGTATIYNVPTAPPVVFQSNVVDANFSILPGAGWAGIYADASGVLHATSFALLTAPTLQATGPGADVQWRPSGGTQPTDTKNWDMLVTGSTGDLALRILDDPFVNATAYATFFRGTGVSLTGAKAVFAVPVQASLIAAGGVAGFTGVKTAGACVVTVSGGVVTNITGC